MGIHCKIHVYRVLCQTESIVICASEIDLRQTFFALLFVALQYNQWAIGSKLINRCSKICQKYSWGALEGDPDAQLALGRAQKLEEDEAMVRGPPLAPFIGCHLKVQHDPGAVQQRF